MKLIIDIMKTVSLQNNYVYLWLIHVEVWQKTTQFCKAIILQQKNKLKKKTMLVLVGGNIIANDEFKKLRDQSIKRIICMQLKLLIRIAIVMNQHL